MNTATVTPFPLKTIETLTIETLNNNRDFREAVRKGFSPMNSLILIINIILFGLLIMFWFWFVGSQQLILVLDEKAVEINNLTTTNDDIVLKNAMDIFINSVKNDQEKLDKVRNDIKNRNKQNGDNFRLFFIPLLIFLIILCIVYIIYIIKYKKGITSREFMLVLTMICMFFTEIIFFIVVIQDFRYIPTSTIVYNLLEKNSNIENNNFYP